MLPDPIAVGIARCQGVSRQHDPAIRCQVTLVPFKQTTANDFGCFGLRRHHHCFADAVEQLFQPIIVGEIVGTHFEF